MTLEALNKKIKSGDLSGIYFFYGEERYLLEKKLDAICRKLITPGTEVFNLFKLEGKKTTAADVIAAIDQFPQMSEKKVVLVKGSGLLNNAVLTDFKLLRDAAKNIPPDTCLILTEDSFDKKKLKNISFIEENGGIINFEYMPVNKIEIWLDELFKKHKKSISNRDISYLVRLCGQSLGKLTGEADKLINYSGDRIKITRGDIDAVADKTVEYRTYDMLDNMIAGRRTKALEQLKYLYSSGEEPFYILALMTSRLSELLMCKLLKDDGLSAAEISDYFDFKRPMFAVNKTINESSRFGEKYLKRMIDKGLFYDIECKQGRLSPWAAVEMYLAEISM